MRDVNHGYYSGNIGGDRNRGDGNVLSRWEAKLLGEFDNQKFEIRA